MKKPARPLKLTPTSVRFFPRTLAALKRAARDEELAVSAMIEKAVTEWLRDHEYLQYGKK